MTCVVFESQVELRKMEGLEATRGYVEGSPRSYALLAQN